MNYRDFRVSGEQVDLNHFEEALISEQEDNEVKEEVLEKHVKRLKELHEKLMAEGRSGIVVVLQALDAAGKDEIIRYIFSHLTPQGLKNTPFGKPTEEELKHDYLWRMHKGMPERGMIGILNRSYYEDVISPRVYDTLGDCPFPKDRINEDIWKDRFKQLNNFESYLHENGFPVVKFFFNMTKDVQKERLLERLETPHLNHEFSPSDMTDRDNWDKYHEAFEEMLTHTATEDAPWYILPADNPWLARKIAIEALIEVLEKINPEYPSFTKEEQKEADKAIKQLKSE